jgi:hypothetical protein
MNLPALTLDRPTLLRLGAGLVSLVAAVAVVAKAVHAPVSAFAGGLVGDFGFGGLFAAVLCTDAVPGLGFQPALFLGYTGGLGFWPLFVVTFGASYIASVLVYGAGRVLARQPWLVERLERWGVGPVLRRQGARAIALASVAPFPYGLATLGAGVTGVPLRTLLVGACFRGVKILFTLVAIWLGWGVGA